VTPQEAKKWFVEHRQEAQIAFDAIGTMLRTGDVEALVDFTMDEGDLKRRTEQAFKSSAEQRRTEPPFDGNPCPACPTIFRGLHAVAHNASLAFQAAATNQGDWARAYRKMAELELLVEEYQPLVDKHFADPMHSHGMLS
jgi:hypothetical protein